MNTDNQRLYRIASRAEWRAAQAAGVVPEREIDKRDGYMHLSTREQVLETARLHFAGSDDLLALEICGAQCADAVKFELAPKRGEAFPHLYRPLKSEEIVDVVAIIRDGTAFRFGSSQIEGSA